MGVDGAALGLKIGKLGRDGGEKARVRMEEDSVGFLRKVRAGQFAQRQSVVDFFFFWKRGCWDFRTEKCIKVELELTAFGWRLP